MNYPEITTDAILYILDSNAEYNPPRDTRTYEAYRNDLPHLIGSYFHQLHLLREYDTARRNRTGLNRVYCRHLQSRLDGICQQIEWSINEALAASDGAYGPAIPTIWALFRDHGTGVQPCQIAERATEMLQEYRSAESDREILNAV